MQLLFDFMLKWSVSIAVIYLFYRFVLRNLTFYQLNRAYLLIYPVIAICIPFIDISSFLNPEKLNTGIVGFIPVVDLQETNGEAFGMAGAVTSQQPLHSIFILFAAGALFLLARLAVQWYSLLQVKRKAVRIYHPNAIVYHVDAPIVPFSFGKAIYLNTSMHNDQELNDIILHEFVHVRQKHSADILFSEILCILNWYNPFAWLVRKAIRQNLEFIADQAVLDNGLDKKTYQYHLLKVVGNSDYSITNNFNFSSLKKRIAMMNKLKSARIHLIRFAFLLPLLAVLLLAFREVVPQQPVSDSTLNTDTIPDVPPAPPIPPPPGKVKAGKPVQPPIPASPDDRHPGAPHDRLPGTSADKHPGISHDKLPGASADRHHPVPPSVIKPGHAHPDTDHPAPPSGVEHPDSKNIVHPAAPATPPVPKDLPKGVKSMQLKNNILNVQYDDGKTERYNLADPKQKAEAEKKFGKDIMPEPPKVILSYWPFFKKDDC